MRHIIFLLILTISACCDKDDSTQKEIPQCIKNSYDVSSASNLIVKQWEKNGEVYYFFNTGAVTWDGAEKIYNSKCEEVCYYCGFCEKTDCIDDFPAYNSSDWVKVLPE